MATKKRVFNHQYNYDWKLHTKRAYNKQASKTNPSDAMTIAEILKRVERGLPISVGKVPIYEGGDVFIPDIMKMDLVDRQELMHRARVQIEEMKVLSDQLAQDKILQQKLDAEKKAAEEKEARRREFEEFQNTTKKS